MTGVFDRKRLFFSLTKTDENETEIKEIKEDKNDEYVKSLKEKVLEKIKLRNLERIRTRGSVESDKKTLTVETVERVDEVQKKGKSKKKLKKRRSSGIKNEMSFSSPYVESSNISYVVDSVDDD